MANSTVEFKVEGMSCGACVRSIERKLSKMAGVVSVRVDLGSGHAVVEYDDSRARPAELLGAVEQIGFRAIPT
ncbi:MAG: heavy-metal-associated domain-containing protein [Acidobacteriota bacterium]|nr:heavy-metal-associated domain-containing protein [Acidobacteriota bacterium]